MKIRSVTRAALAVLVCALSGSAMAQTAGDSFIKVSESRTKLLDKGDISVNGVLAPADAYSTRESFHATFTGGYYIVNGVAVEASISSPITTNNIPGGALAGTPNLGDDSFVLATLGASLHPFHSQISPYVGAGLQAQIPVQTRDALAVNLHVPGAVGPYVQGGVDVAMNKRWGIFVDVRKAFYHTNASGLLPLNASYTAFASVNAKAVLDPLTVQVGATVRFGKGAGDDTKLATDHTKWTIRAGISNLKLANRLSLNVGGAAFAGAGLATFEHQTLSAQIGRFITPNIAINATLGLPPTIGLFGAGTIGGLPKLGDLTYGPTALTAQYHFTRAGRIRPYVGAGASYLIAFKTKDGAFQNLKVSNALSPVVEAGTDLMINTHFGLFIDAKKAFLRPNAYGTFGGNNVVGHSQIDPLVLSSGFAFHF
jgi:outer membrane protein